MMYATKCSSHSRTNLFQWVCSTPTSFDSNQRVCMAVTISFLELCCHWWVGGFDGLTCRKWASFDDLFRKSPNFGDSNNRSIPINDSLLTRHLFDGKKSLWTRLELITVQLDDRRVGKLPSEPVPNKSTFHILTREMSCLSLAPTNESLHPLNDVKTVTKFPNENSLDSLISVVHRVIHRVWHATGHPNPSVLHAGRDASQWMENVWMHVRMGITAIKNVKSACHAPPDVQHVPAMECA